jgi:hypothetical protein
MGSRMVDGWVLLVWLGGTARHRRPCAHKSDPSQAGFRPNGAVCSDTEVARIGADGRIMVPPSEVSEGYGSRKLGWSIFQEIAMTQTPQLASSAVAANRRARLLGGGVDSWRPMPVGGRGVVMGAWSVCHVKIHTGSGANTAENRSPG